MNILDQLAEAKIKEAQAKGEFENLAGNGEPLQLGTDQMVDPSLRVAYRILKNAGFVPAEVLRRQRISSIEALLQHVSDPVKRKPLLAQLLKYLSPPDGSVSVRADHQAQYYRQLTDRLDKHIKQ